MLKRLALLSLAHPPVGAWSRWTQTMQLSWGSAMPSDNESPLCTRQWATWGNDSMLLLALINLGETKCCVCVSVLSPPCDTISQCFYWKGYGQVWESVACGDPVLKFIEPVTYFSKASRVLSHINSLWLRHAPVTTLRRQHFFGGIPHRILEAIFREGLKIQ